jgi:plasmid replication initiation protein
MINKDILVVKSNYLIEAFTEMTQNECKILAYLISKIKPSDTEFLIQHISFSELNEVLNIKGTQTYTYMKKYSDELLKKKISVRYPNRDRLDVNWFSYSHYRDNEGMLELGFNQKLENELLYLRGNYTMYRLKNICNLNSPNSIRIYELLKQYEKIGYRIIELVELKALLGINDKHRLYADFKRYVLISSQKALKENTDLCFEFKEIKRGRRVDAIEFKIKSNTIVENVPSIENRVEELQNKIDKVINAVVYPNKVSEWIKDGKEEIVLFYLDNWSRWDWKTKANKAGFFVDLVDNERPIPLGEKGIRVGLDKPIQSTNYEQREYDDKFFESLYTDVEAKNKEYEKQKKQEKQSK